MQKNGYKGHLMKIIFQKLIFLKKWMLTIHQFLFQSGKIKTKKYCRFSSQPLHAKVLKQKADSLKLKNVVYAPRIGIIDKSGQGVSDFY